MGAMARRDLSWVQSLTRQELIDVLERNSYIEAAASIRAGSSVEQATAYAAGGRPRYADREGEMVQEYIDRLQGTGL